MPLFAGGHRSGVTEECQEECCDFSSNAPAPPPVRLRWKVHFFFIYDSHYLLKFHISFLCSLNVNVVKAKLIKTILEKSSARCFMSAQARHPSFPQEGSPQRR